MFAGEKLLNEKSVLTVIVPFNIFFSRKEVENSSCFRLIVYLEIWWAAFPPLSFCCMWGSDVQLSVWFIEKLSAAEDVCLCSQSTEVFPWKVLKNVDIPEYNPILVLFWIIFCVPSFIHHRLFYLSVKFHFLIYKKGMARYVKKKNSGTFVHPKLWIFQNHKLNDVTTSWRWQMRGALFREFNKIVCACWLYGT